MDYLYENIIKAYDCKLWYPYYWPDTLFGHYTKYVHIYKKSTLQFIW